MKYHSAVLHSPGNLILEYRAIEPLKDDELLLKVEATGICGSDLSIYKGDFPSRLTLPRVLGHEWCGLVVERGAIAKKFSVGTRIVSEEILWCGDCRPCRDGWFDYCIQPEELGFTVDGALASHVKVKEKYCHSVPDSVPSTIAALVEPLSVAWNTLNHAAPGVIPGQKICVVGLGPIGIFSAMWAKASGALVFGIEPSKYRRSLAKKVGINLVFESLDDAENNNAFNEPFDGIVEASGVHDMIDPLLCKVAHKGWIAVVGHCTCSTKINVENIVLRGLTLSGTIGQIGHSTYTKVLNALASGLLDPTPLITHKFPLSEVNRAFKLAQAGRAFGKILIMPDDCAPSERAGQIYK